MTGSGLVLHGATDLLLMQDYLQLRQQEKGLRYSGLKRPSLVSLIRHDHDDIVADDGGDNHHHCDYSATCLTWA